MSTDGISYGSGVRNNQKTANLVFVIERKSKVVGSQWEFYKSDGCNSLSFSLEEDFRLLKEGWDGYEWRLGVYSSFEPLVKK